MPDPNLYEVADESVIQAEDTNQLVRAVRALQSHRESDAGQPFEGDVHFQSGTAQVGTLAHANTAPRTWTMPDADGTVALESQVVSEHGQLAGREADDHPQYQTEARADAWLAGKTTDQLPEGLGHKYHTDGRVRQALGTTSPLAYNSANGVFSIPQAGAAQAGYLSASDWSGFNSKAAGSHTHGASDIASGSLGVERGGTGLGSIASGKLLYASASNVLAALTLGSNLSIAGGVLDAVVGSDVIREVDTTVNTLASRGLSSFTWGTLVSKTIYVPAVGATVRCDATSVCKNNSTGGEGIQIRVNIDGNAGSAGSSVTAPSGGSRRASATHEYAVSGGRFVTVTIEAYANVVAYWDHQRSDMLLSTDPSDGA